MAFQHSHSTPTPRLRARRAHRIDLAVTIVPDCARTPEWAALWRRLLGPVPTPDTPDTPSGKARGEAPGR
jgi:hypothetical protein